MKLEFVAPPLSHQSRVLKKAWSPRAFGLFHEMGCGKTFSAINLARGRALIGKIQLAVVICPKSIRLVWEQQLEEFSSSFSSVVAPFPTALSYYIDGNLQWVIVSVESLSQGHTFDNLTEYIAKKRGGGVFTIIDESSRIKNHKALRTRQAIKLGKISDYRMILTGTPVTQGIQDLYAQMYFLDPAIIGARSFLTFRNRYCEMGGFMAKQITGYQNIDELLQKIAPFVDVVKKKDVLDLPPKVYEKRIVECTKEQMKAISELKKLYVTEMGGHKLTVASTLELYTRFQQIIGGNYPYKAKPDDEKYTTKPMEGKNPKIEDMKLVIQDEIPEDAKVIIWARFRPEIERIKEILPEDSFVEFHGGIDEDGRKQAIFQFNHVPRVRFFVATYAGAYGLNLTIATFELYYSNSFSLEARLQSEDRAHRYGQKKSVTYIDFFANIKYDLMLAKALAYKKSLAMLVEEGLTKGEDVT